ncbi:dTDP-rhamnosyl transferase RfbG [Leuconostoc mesenteroides subsp. sake]|uniref:glycosyltransferase n=1 Tax=Leuconostoc mesenteroides TaxID=1245 RepID=UPI00116D5FC5|nr:glycosyltransferase [Leuconostoc mesenteroides]GEK66117.1 dTDP-rhamnosyl transferase RfbG [Leuconostoc mesenteroides subsp. sake]
MALDKVLVLLATYNGAEYIDEQLFSILNQKDVKADVIIFDDKSTDDTLKHIEEIKNTYPNRITVICNTDKVHGPLHSFISLINFAQHEKKNDYYRFISFADQDDIWLPRKLINAIKSMQKFNAEMSISSGISTNLYNYAEITTYDRRVYTFGEALLKNNAIGMTMVLRTNFLDTIHIPIETGMNVWLHDHLLYLIALYRGKRVVFVDEPGVIYRQHEHNAIGDKKQGIIHRIQKKVDYVLKSQRDRNFTAELLKDNFSGTPENIELVNKYLNYRNQSLFGRLRLVGEGRIFSQKNDVELITKVLAVFKIL